MTELHEKVNDAIAAWEDEARLWQGWREVPEMLGMSRRRLPRLLELNAPAQIIETEIEWTYTRIAQMQEMRRKDLH